MKKQEFMRYTSAEFAAFCGDLYKAKEISNFCYKAEYTKAMVRCRINECMIYFAFCASGNITIKGYAFEDPQFDMIYYEWTEGTATKEIVKQLKAAVQSALETGMVFEIESCFRSGSTERIDE